ncbi:hypothetical protein [Chitinivibrio alkaliphilus]|uniref:Uncharacterized protein n=1 Tax=Chitinivibrio alkaliphilus ACht1 TaxID=1313304 RepID=U7DCB7_9BACT|nr:hypothetical protein [Chitinivibrio alkaliphilus]ERP39218.1 hypothetical protein CALK_0003 [Chitinivibrio alkaliphilus ACht1]
MSHRYGILQIQRSNNDSSPLILFCSRPSNEKKSHKALAYALSRALFEGHVSLNFPAYVDSCTPFGQGDDLEHEVVENPFIENSDDVKDLAALQDGEDDSYCVHVHEDAGEESVPPAFFVFQKDRVYLHRYFIYETRILHHISRLRSHRAHPTFSSGFF